MDNLTHVSVMPTECLNGLNVKNGGIYFDGTLGGAGHSQLILKNSSPNGKLIATDLDDYAINRANERLKEYNGRFILVRDNFKNFENIKNQYASEGFDGILLDLGISSFQIDDETRGFAYSKQNAELDMRMDKRSSFSAKTVVNTYSEQELKKIISEYGEEKFAYKIAKNIVLARKEKPINTCGELVKIIEKSIPEKFKHEGHVAKRTFQAIRIEVNDELNGLKQTVKTMVNGLKKGGRIAIITFHSLEDRLVKQAFNELATDCVCPKSFPICVCGKRKEIEIITKHPLLPSEEEIKINKRAKSAKLRIAEKL